MAGQIFSAYKETLERFPVALPEMTNGLMHFGPSPVQIIISGPENEEKTQALIQVSNLPQVPELPIAITRAPLAGEANNLKSQSQQEGI